MSAPVVIWGAGAIGGSLGAKLLRAGHEVIFVDNVREHVDAINSRGLGIVGPLLQTTVRATARLPEDLVGSYECIILCVKALHTEAAAKALAPRLAANGYVVSAQNGLNELVIEKVVGRERTIGCFVNFGADYMEPGIVQYSGRGAVVVGELDGGENGPPRRPPPAAAGFRAGRRPERQHLGIPVGQAHLWRAAVCHGADQ